MIYSPRRGAQFDECGGITVTFEVIGVLPTRDRMRTALVHIGDANPVPVRLDGAAAPLPHDHRHVPRAALQVVRRPRQQLRRRTRSRVKSARLVMTVAASSSLPAAAYAVKAATVTKMGWQPMSIEKAAETLRCFLLSASSRVRTSSTFLRSESSHA